MLKYLLITAAFIAGCVAANAFGEETMAKKMFNYANKLRVERGLRPHEWSEKCENLSQRWSERMASEGFFSHGGGENIIVVGSNSIESLFATWMNSSAHRAFILGNSKYAGYGIAVRGNRAYASGAFRNLEVDESDDSGYTYVQRGRGRRRR